MATMLLGLTAVAGSQQPRLDFARIASAGLELSRQGLLMRDNGGLR